jgi:hypothetical protein
VWIARYSATVRHCADEFFLGKRKDIGIVHFGYTTDLQNRSDWNHSIIKDGLLYHFQYVNSNSGFTAEGVFTDRGFETFDSCANIKPLDCE